VRGVLRGGKLSKKGNYEEIQKLPEGTQFNVENPKFLCLKCSLIKDYAANMFMCELCVCAYSIYVHYDTDSAKAE
jgi:hypothetical protein